MHNNDYKMEFKSSDELSDLLIATARTLRRNYVNQYPGLTRWDGWLYSQTARFLETLARRLAR